MHDNRPARSTIDFPSDIYSNCYVPEFHSSISPIAHPAFSVERCSHRQTEYTDSACFCCQNSRWTDSTLRSGGACGSLQFLPSSVLLGIALTQTFPPVSLKPLTYSKKPSNYPGWIGRTGLCLRDVATVSPNPGTLSDAASSVGPSSQSTTSTYVKAGNMQVSSTKVRANG
jgi:hypothetical protein